MKTAQLILSSILLSSFVLLGHCQAQFNSCSAAFLDNKLVVDDYSPKGDLTVKNKYALPHNEILVQ